jgi:hypothetical protein
MSSDVGEVMNNGSHEIDRNSGVVGDLPPTIFKYYDYSIRSLLNLKKQVIHFGSPARFNDPYDCATSAQIINPSPGEVEAIRRQYLSDPRLPEPDRRQLSSESQVELGLRLVHSASEVLDAQRERFLATRGVSCFSERNDDLRMWAQYGDCYGGFCLEFRSEFAPFSKLQRVRYSEQAPSVALDELLLAKDYSAIFQRMYCTKSGHEVGILYQFRCVAELRQAPAGAGSPSG